MISLSRTVCSLSLILALAFAAGGCATQVSVDPSSNAVGNYQYGILKGTLQGTPQQAFDATNSALDELKYYRSGQHLTKDKLGQVKEAFVVAYGFQSLKISVTAEAGKEDGTTDLKVDLDPSNLPKAQQIYGTIVKYMRLAGAGATVATPAPATSSGLSAPSRPQQ